jgi:hypothetical protein
MGFLKALTNALAGKPAYTPEDIERSQQGAGAHGQTSASPQAQPQQHIVPVVRVERVESRISGNRLDVSLHIHNESPVAVWIDKISLLGTTCNVHDDLQPGQSYERQAYSGPMLPNDDNKHAEVQYFTDQTREYFAARHETRYRREGDGWHVDELRLILPIKELH